MEPLSEFVLSCSVFCSRASVDSVNLNLLKSRNRLGNRMKIIFDVHTFKASKELKVVLLHLWRAKRKDSSPIYFHFTRGFSH
jgi:hypothetical protein